VSEQSASRNPSRPIYLIGLMGVGKSTVGRLLAARLGRRFCDSDQEIESRCGRTIAAIFAEEGEAGFRRLEAETIAALSNEGTVIALGGGAITPAGAVERLLEVGDLVYLEAPVEILAERIGDASNRPLLAGLDADARLRRLRDLLEERRPLYERATWRIDARGTADRVVERILAILESVSPAEPDQGALADRTVAVSAAPIARKGTC
jgi:shikimate kinase